MCYVINEDGEIIDEINVGDKILRKNSAEYFNKTVDLNKGDYYVKVYTKCLFEIANELNGRESIMIYYLLQYLTHTSCILAHSNGKLLTKRFIINELKQSESTVDRAVNGLIQKGIIGKHKTLDDWCYTINPYIFMNGPRIDTAIAKFYEKTKWAKL